MGCDIHVSLEIGDQDGWRDATPFKRNKWPDEAEFVRCSVASNRNYALFGLLAGVRSDDSASPLFEGRGIPSDLSESVRDWLYGWCEDRHSHTHFLLSELIEAEQSHSGEVVRSGHISPEAAELLDTSGVETNMWCGWTSDESWPFREWTQQYNPLTKFKDDLISALEVTTYNFERKDDYSNVRVVVFFDN